MDKFDEFLSEKAKDEKENLTLPNSFDKRVEDILGDLDQYDESNKNSWYKSKKNWALVASFAFVCFIGFGVPKINKNSGKLISGRSQSLTREKNDVNESSILYDQGIEPYSQNGYGENNEGIIVNTNLNVEKISEIIINDSEISFKKINDKVNIEKIVKFINALELYQIEDQKISSNEFVIKFNGDEESTLIFTGVYVNFNGVWYKNSQEVIVNKETLYELLNE